MDECASCLITGYTAQCERCARRSSISITEAAENCQLCKNDPLRTCTTRCAFASMFARMDLDQLRSTSALLDNNIRERQTNNHHTEPIRKQPHASVRSTIKHSALHPTINMNNTKATTTTTTLNTSATTVNTNKTTRNLHQPTPPDYKHSELHQNQAFYASNVSYMPTTPPPGTPPQLVFLAFWPKKHPRSYHYFDSCKQYANRKKPPSFITRLEAENTEGLSLCHYCKLHYEDPAHFTNMFT